MVNSSGQVPNTRIGLGPVFWGSLVGVFVGSILSGLSYLGIIGIEKIITDQDSLYEPHAIIVIFCCLLCIRYYASVVFFVYDPVTSPDVMSLNPKSRRSIFAVQLLLILGCGLNIALLPLYGAAVATGVIVLQALIVGEYWRQLWKIHFRSSSRDVRHRRVGILISDIAILGAALTFFVWENGWAAYDGTGAGLLMGAIILSFIGESSTMYFDTIKIFYNETVQVLQSSEDKIS